MLLKFQPFRDLNLEGFHILKHQTKFPLTKWANNLGVGNAEILAIHSDNQKVAQI
jgi:hypothetical protein